MIFNSANDIKCDIVNKISDHMIDCINNNLIIDRKNILSLLRTYFHELKIRNLLSKYNVESSDDCILIDFTHNNKPYDLKVDLYSQIRKLKIDKIYKSIEHNFVIL